MQPRVLVAMLVCGNAMAQGPQSKPSLRHTPMQKRLKTLINSPSRTALADVLNGPCHPDGRPGHQRVALAAVVLASGVQLKGVVERLASLLKDTLQSILPAQGRRVAAWHIFRPLHTVLASGVGIIELVYLSALFAGVFSYASYRTPSPPRDASRDPKAIRYGPILAVFWLAILLCKSGDFVRSSFGKVLGAERAAHRYLLGVLFSPIVIFAGIVGISLYKEALK